MKIRLEPGEIAAILKDWSRLKYKTHNINCDFIISKTTFEAELEIILEDDRIANENTSRMTDELIQAQIGLPRVSQEPDLSLEFAGNTEGL